MLLMDQLEIECSNYSSLGFINLLEWLTKLWNVLLTTLPVIIIKGYMTQEQPDGKMHRYGEGMGKRAPPSHATSKCSSHSASPRVHQPRSFLNPSTWDYMKASLHQHDWFNRWPLVINLTIRPSPFLGNQGVGLKIPHSIYNWFLWQPAPHLRCFSEVTSLT